MRLKSLQEMASNSPNVKQLVQLQAIADSGLSRQSQIIQMTIWEKTAKGWKPTVEYSSNLCIPPDWMKKNDDNYAIGTRYDDEKDKIVSGPQDEEKSAYQEDSPAFIHRASYLESYANLKPHIEGELKDGVLKGGHLLDAMKKKWKNALIIEESSGDTAKVWNLKWSIDVNKIPQINKDSNNRPSGKIKQSQIKNIKLSKPEYKLSTMFPESWTWDDLSNKLFCAEVINNQLIIDGEIKVIKKGDTFYPEPNLKHSPSLVSRRPGGHQAT